MNLKRSMCIGVIQCETKQGKDMMRGRYDRQLDQGESSMTKTEREFAERAGRKGGKGNEKT